jgi:hypothetical protein
MILSKSEIDVITENGIYRCGLLTQQFAYKLLGENVSPLGNVFCFKAPCVLGQLHIEDSLILVGELPNCNMFGASCFQRLYASQLGTFLSELLGKSFYIHENSIFVEEQQVSISILNQIKDSVVFHLFFPTVLSTNVAQQLNLFQLKMKEDIEAEFKDSCVNAFNYLTRSIFLESRRDNF